MKKLIYTLIALTGILSLLISGCGLKPANGTDTTLDPSYEQTAEASGGMDTAAKTSEITVNYPSPLPHEDNGTPAVTASASPTPSATPKASIVPKPTTVPKPTRTPTPEPKHSDPPISYMKEQTESLISTFGGEWSVYFERADTGESFTINNKSMVSASLIKLFVYGAVTEQIEQGILPEGDYDGYLENMISYSDNESCNILIDAAGGFDAVNDFIRRNGFDSTELNRKMLDWNGLENYTSAADCGHLIKEVLKGTFVSKEASGRLQELMKGQSVTWKIPAGVPEDIVTGNKSGELTNIENDAAFIQSPVCTYILCVMTSDVDSGIAIDNIAQLSSSIYSMLINAQTAAA